MMNNFYSNGLKFECKNCTACCCLEGGVVMLSQKDLSRLASHFNQTEEEFIKGNCQFLQNDDDKKYYLCLLDKADTAQCIFWDKGCTCYEARPTQCRTYPFWTKIMSDEKSWNEEKNFCPGINECNLISAQEIEKNLSEYKENRSLIICIDEDEF